MKKVYGTDDGESPCFSYVENYMEKSEKNKYKDYLRTKNKKWIHIPQMAKDRTCASGVTFWGKYVPRKADDG